MVPVSGRGAVVLWPSFINAHQGPLYCLINYTSSLPSLSRLHFNAHKCLLFYSFPKANLQFIKSLHKTLNDLKQPFNLIHMKEKSCQGASINYRSKLKCGQYLHFVITIIGLIPPLIKCISILPVDWSPIALHHPIIGEWGVYYVPRPGYMATLILLTLHHQTP